MTIKQYYIKSYPSDDLGDELKDGTTLCGLLHVLFIGGDVYEYLGVADTLVRERVFERLAFEMGQSYNFVYNLWLASDE